MNALVIIKTGGIDEDRSDQLKKCHIFARSKDWHVSNVVINEQEVDLMKEIKNASGHIDIILANDMTRAYGKISELRIFLKTLKELDIRFYSINDGDINDWELIDIDEFNGTNT